MLAQTHFIKLHFSSTLLSMYASCVCTLCFLDEHQCFNIVFYTLSMKKWFFFSRCTILSRNRLKQARNVFPKNLYYPLLIDITITSICEQWHERDMINTHTEGSHFSISKSSSFSFIIWYSFLWQKTIATWCWVLCHFSHQWWR